LKGRSAGRERACTGERRGGERGGRRREREGKREEKRKGGGSENANAREKEGERDLCHSSHRGIKHELRGRPVRKALPEVDGRVFQ